MQGGGTPGGLGLDYEFFESVLVPQIILNGFLGFHPVGDGFHLQPSLPGDWPELRVDRIQFQDLILQVRASRQSIEVLREEGQTGEPVLVRLPGSDWQAVMLDARGQQTENLPLSQTDTGVLARIDWTRPGAEAVRFNRTVQP